MIGQDSRHERRKDPRLESSIPVKICREDGDLVTETKNISRSGVYCCVQEYIAPMTKLKVRLLLTASKGVGKFAKKISCGGVVVRSEPVADGRPHHIAIFFNDITKRDAKSITDYVISHAHRSQSV